MVQSFQCRAKGVPSFLTYFKTLSVGLIAGIEPATSPNAVKRCTDWANPVRLNSDSDGSEFFSPMTVTQEVNFALFYPCLRRRRSKPSVYGFDECVAGCNAGYFIHIHIVSTKTLCDS